MKKYIYKNKEYSSLYPIKQLIPNYGIPTTVTDEQLKELGVEVVIIKPALEDVKANKKLELKYERDTREVALINYKGKQFDYDAKARERLNIARQALEDNNLPKQMWTCADNTTIELTVADFKALNTLAAQRSGQLHEQYNKLKGYIDTLKIIEDVEVVNFDTEVV